MMKLKPTYFQRAKDHVKNRHAAYAVSLTVAACTALVLFARDCGTRYTPMDEPIRGDRVCMQSEMHQVELDSHGRQKMDGDKPVLNRHYSPEDCHEGDRVWQNATKLSELRGPEGLPITDLMDRYLDGTEIRLPLENESSVDYPSHMAKEQPCAARGEDTPEITRDLIITKGQPARLVQRTLAEIEALHGRPESVRLGDNYYVTAYGRNEVCETSPPLCTAESNEECSCPNHISCRPAEAAPPPHCGNGTIEPTKNEQCDTKSRRPRNGCAPNHSCNNDCQCERDAPPPPSCGNSRVEADEQCDPPDSRCGTNGTCTSSCQCRERPPEPECGNSRVEAGEQCDPPNSSCANGGTCNSSCQCQTPQPTGCRAEVRRLIATRLNGQLSGPLLPRVRAQAGEGPVQATATVRVVGGNASVVGSVSLSGGGSIPGSEVRIGNVGDANCQETVGVTVSGG